MGYLISIPSSNWLEEVSEPKVTGHILGRHLGVVLGLAFCLGPVGAASSDPRGADAFADSVNQAGTLLSESLLEDHRFGWIVGSGAFATAIGEFTGVMDREGWGVELEMWRGRFGHRLPILHDPIPISTDD